MPTRTELAASFPKWSRVLFEPQWRFVSVRGGRGSGKTKNIARAIVIKCTQAKIRVLCTREVQDSIKESVYEQIRLEIEELGLQSSFQVLNNEIRCTDTGSLIIFKGLNEFSVDGLKSLANINLAWLEEAQTLQETSWDKFEPSIRAEGSQIWMSWNPELETDYIYQQVVKRGLPNCANLFVNFDQNPWLPDVLKESEQNMAGRDPIKHRHIWLGEPLPAVAGAIYFNEIATMEREERIRNLTEDPLLSKYVVMDLGINDYTTAQVIQQGAGEVRIIDYVENNRVPQKWFSDRLTEMGHSDAVICLPHDARAQNTHTGMTTVQLWESYGWEVEVVSNIGVEEGIRQVREMLPRTFIDKTRCEQLIEHLKRYQRTKTGHPLHDEHSHASDGTRYVAVHLPNMSNNRRGWSGGKINYRKLTVT